MSMFTALPTQIYTWAKMPQAEFQNVASAAIIILLVILLLMNAVAIFLRKSSLENINPIKYNII